MSSENQPLWLGTPPTTVISLESEPGVYYPGVGVWLAQIDDDIRAKLSDENGGNTAIGYITEIEPLENGPLAVIKFRLAHDEFENMDAVEDSRLKITFSLTVPVQFVAIAHSLSLVEEGFPIVIFEGEPPVGASHLSWNIDDRFFGLKFAPVNTMTSEEFIDQIANIVTSTYHTPLFPVAFDEVDPSSFQQNVDAPLSLRKAQAVLLSIISGLAQGNDVALSRLLKMDSWIDDFYERRIDQETDNEDAESVSDGRSVATSDSDEVDNDTAHDEFMEAFLYLMGIVYRNSSPAALYDTSAQDMPDLEKNNGIPSESDDEFSKIFTSNDLESVFVQSFHQETPYLHRPDLTATDLLVADPFADGFPHSMKALENRFAEFGDANKLGDLLRWDLSKPENTDVALQTYPFSAIVMASILISSARAARVIEVKQREQTDEETNEDSNITASLLAAIWLSGTHDTNMWEIPAFSPALVDYDIDSFADLLSSVVGTEQGSIALYLPNILHGIGHLLTEEEWTPENLDSRLEMLDVKLPNLPQARRIMYFMLDEMNNAMSSGDFDEDDEEDPCAPAIATNFLLQNETLADLAKTIALIIPILADVHAAREDLDVGSAEWKSERRSYVSNMLHEFVAHQSRVFG